MTGFDKWCRVKSGLSNYNIAQALGVSVEDVQAWREGEPVPNPAETLRPMQAALSGPWPPATAHQAWLELVELIEAARPTDPPGPRKLAPPVEIPLKTTTKKKAAAPAAKTDPELDALKKEMDAAQEAVNAAVQAAEQTSAGWFTRTSEKFKKYAPLRSPAHRKAFLAHTLGRAQPALEKLQTRRSELTSALARLHAALSAFDEMQRKCGERMEKKRDENVDLWRQLKASAPVVATARQAHDKGKSKSLAGLEDALKRAETLVADWQAKHDAIADEAGVSLNWVTRESKLGQRLAGGTWDGDTDPFEGVCICKDKLADNYRQGPSQPVDRPIEIDLVCEIDLSIAGLEQRQKVARSL